MNIYFFSLLLFTDQKRTRHREIGDNIGIRFIMSLYANGAVNRIIQWGRKWAMNDGMKRKKKKKRFGNLPMAFYLPFERNIKTSLAVYFFNALSSLLNDKIVTSFFSFVFFSSHLCGGRMLFSWKMHQLNVENC